MDKIYTAQEMRDRAKACEFNGDLITTAMLRQAADALEREKLIIGEVSKIDTMKVAFLDGHPIHQQTNAKRVAAILEFFPKVKEIIGGVRPIEREEKREKKYEYRITTTTSATEYGFLTLKSAKEFKHHHKLDEPIFRRPVGEWEEVNE